MEEKAYNIEYYKNNNQSGDRPALYFFSSILKKYLKSGKIFEYGCGTGFFIKKFESKKYKRIAYDISKYAMEQTQRNNFDITTVQKPWFEIEDNSLDCIASLHVLEHIEKPSDIINKFNTKLKKGGIFFFVVPNTSSIGKKIKKGLWFGYRDKTHVSLLSPEEWIKITTNQNFKIIKVGADGLWDIPYLKKMPIIIQKILFYPTAAIQIWTNNLFIPLCLGENLIIISKKL